MVNILHTTKSIPDIIDRNRSPYFFPMYELIDLIQATENNNSRRCGLYARNGTKRQQVFSLAIV